MSIRKELFQLCDELFEKKDDNTKEIFRKKNAFLFAQNDLFNHRWYLYQIKISSNPTHLGFIIPSELIQLPIFNDGLVRIEIIFQKVVNYVEHQNLFEKFSRHLFEHVFNYTNIEFNLQSSPFKLLPCLLTNSNEIDFHRMRDIIQRHRKPIEHPVFLSNIELYTVWYLPTKPLLISRSNITQKRASDRKSNHESYAEYYEKILPNIRIEKEWMMGSMKVIAKKKLSLNFEENPMKISDQTIYYYPIELLHYTPLNQSDFQLISQLPSILIRIVQLYHLEKFRQSLAEHLQSYSLIKPNEIYLKDCLAEYMQIVSWNYLTYDFSVRNNEQPFSDILFQAITRRSVNEQFDMENLEILGDCFLKLTVSMSLYYLHPTNNVGQLTMEKMKEISNENLYRLAVENKLKNYLYTEKILLQGTESNWLPPGYISKVNTHTFLSSKCMIDKYTHQISKRKAFADMIEALIGAFLMSSNSTTTIRFMHWLGLNVIPFDEKLIVVPLPTIVSEDFDEEIRRIYWNEGFQEIEIRLNYVFRNKAYLIAAFTHPSKLTYSYERLEFLGDALLDFLVVRHIFLNYERDLTPGRVTDIRQDLTNNNRLAYILVSSNLHEKIRYHSKVISNQMLSYLTNRHLFPDDPSVEAIPSNVNSIAAPKIFADVFEALLAAIFFDSNNSLELVWKIIEPFLGRLMNRSILNPKLNPIRIFFDQGGQIITEFLDETDAICLVRLANGSVYEGHGRNKKLARYDACQKALNSRN